MIWRRRNDGFEWKAYVPTMVLARRKARQEKIAEVREAAVEGLKEAGRRGLEAGAEGARIAGAGLEAGVRKIAELPAQGMEVAAPEIARVHRQVSRKIAPLTAWITGVRTALVIVAVVAGGMGIVRAIQFGLDQDARIALIVAAGAATLIAIARLFAPPDDNATTTRLVRALKERFAAPSAASDESRSPATHKATSAGAPPNATTIVEVPALPWPLAAAALFAALMVWLAWPVLVSGPSVPDRPAERSAAADVDAMEGVAASERSGDISGRARAIDPGRIRIGTRFVTLSGIEPLAPDQTCRTEAGRVWNCGAAATSALSRLVRGSVVVCDPEQALSDSDAIATCEARGRDVAAELVRQGHAFASGVLSSPYRKEEAEAAESKSGVWAGEGERAEAWRKRLWEEAAAKRPEGCPIKARSVRGHREYLTPEMKGYARAEMNEAEGDKWFCTETEAEAAGFTRRVR
ncbi:MAG: thermonuclease family protein [Hyphomicrobium sp.]|nr:thermonuclease family protein [Hyphomicrobium sp.]